MVLPDLVRHDLRLMALTAQRQCLLMRDPAFLAVATFAGELRITGMDLVLGVADDAARFLGREVVTGWGNLRPGCRFFTRRPGCCWLLTAGTQPHGPGQQDGKWRMDQKAD